MKQLKRLYQAVTCAAIIGGTSGGAMAQPPVTVILVHGAFADSSSWNAVISKLQHQGLRVVSAANPLRSLDGDVASVRQLIRATPGNVVLIGHSYGGAVISGAATSQPNVKALVYVAAFAPTKGKRRWSFQANSPVAAWVVHLASLFPRPREAKTCTSTRKNFTRSLRQTLAQQLRA